MGALATAVQQGKALYVGISSYSRGQDARSRRAPARVRRRRASSTSRTTTCSTAGSSSGLLDTLEREGMGCIAFSALAQGVLTDKYLNGIPQDARINRPGGGSLERELLSEKNLARVRALNDLAKARGQSLAQMALAWVLRDPRVTSTLIGASNAGADPRERRRAAQPRVHGRGARAIDRLSEK